MTNRRLGGESARIAELSRQAENLRKGTAEYKWNMRLNGNDPAFQQRYTDVAINDPRARDEAAYKQAAAQYAEAEKRLADEIAAQRKDIIDYLKNKQGYSEKQAEQYAKIYIEGRIGTRFSIRMRNNSYSRKLFVPTIDGLSIMDGKEGDFNSRGYIIPGYSSITIEGWRTSDKDVASFYFSSPNDSYRKKMNMGNNLGVIGGGGGAGGGGAVSFNIRIGTATNIFTADNSPGCAGAGYSTAQGATIPATSVSAPGNLETGQTIDEVRAYYLPAGITLETALIGEGGELGQNGSAGSASAGGLAGKAIVNNANITWTNTGDRRGAIT